ncbi:MAG: hypothetical protein Q9219_006471 [cf. Caloplaca sp. 3 TL-2023]
MHLILFAEAFYLSLVFTLPTSESYPDHNLARRESFVDCPAQNGWVRKAPEPRWPAPYNANTCPSIEDSYGALEFPHAPTPGADISDGELRKRLHAKQRDDTGPSDTMRASLPSIETRQEYDICQIIARAVFQHVDPDEHRQAVTGEITLTAGVRYVFSISTCAVIDSVSAWLHRGGDDYVPVADAAPGDEQGFLNFVPAVTGVYHFFVEFGQNIFQNGALRLYQIGPGK